MRKLACVWPGPVSTRHDKGPQVWQPTARPDAELRRHILRAAQLANDVGDTPTDDERSEIEDELEEIGRLTKEHPVAASMIVNHRTATTRVVPKRAT